MSLEVTKEVAKALLPAKQRYVQVRTFDAYDSATGEQLVDQVRRDIDAAKDPIHLHGQRGLSLILRVGGASAEVFLE